MFKSVILLSALASASAFAGVGWRNLDSDHHLGGRKASSGYLQGKVVFVCRWDASNTVDVATLLARMEDVWEGFKTKQFVLLGSPYADMSDLDALRQRIGEAKVSFPVYADAGITNREPRVAGGLTLYAVNEMGQVIYRGKDERMATQAVVQSLTDMDAPKSAKHWRKFIDYELENLPAHAYVRLKDFKKAFPKDAREYASKEKELAALPNMKDVADLVAFAKRAKDAPVFGPKDRAKAKKYQSLVEGVLERCASLKELDDPRMAQEAKNALADLKWIQATF